MKEKETIKQFIISYLILSIVGLILLLYSYETSSAGAILLIAGVSFSVWGLSKYQDETEIKK